jgi:hypothetical protein
MKQGGKSFPAGRQSACIAAVLVFTCVTASAQTANVNVVNTPSVRVINRVPVTGSVNAVVTGPVDAQGSARSAVSNDCEVNNLYPSGTGTCTIANVPAGQILVIESMLCSAYLPTGIRFDSIVLYVNAPVPGGTQAGLVHFLAMTPAPNGNFAGLSAYTLMTPNTKLYAFGPTLSSGGVSVPVTLQVQAGTLPATNGAPSFFCSMAGVLESQ